MNIAYIFPTKSSIKNYYLDPSSSTFIKTITEEKFITDLPYPSILLSILMHASVVSKFSPKGCSQICTTDTNIKNSITIVHKNFFSQRELLCKMKINKNLLVFAVIDGVVVNLDLADAILCCSHGAYQHYSTVQDQCPVFFVEHTIDLRMKQMQPYTDKFSAFYFGSSQNFQIYNGIFECVRPCFTEYENIPYPDFITYLKFANFHYAVRPKMPKLIFKPFTKGFTASVCFSNILVHKDDGDANIYLCNDYPYLIKEDLTENVVLDYLKKAQHDFGGKDWNAGLEMMYNLRKFFDHKYIALQFWSSMENLNSKHTLQHMTLKNKNWGGLVNKWTMKNTKIIKTRIIKRFIEELIFRLLLLPMLLFRRQSIIHYVIEPRQFIRILIDRSHSQYNKILNYIKNHSSKP